MSRAGAWPRALLGRICIALVLCVALAGAGVVAVNRYIDDQIARIPRVALTTASSVANGTNFLIVGSDSREFVASEGEDVAFGTSSDTGPPRSDTMMVLHADSDRSYAVSFPRDTWVTIPGRGEMKLNAAFNDGPQAVIDTLQANFGLGIDHYLEVDFRSFEGLVDAVGGVPVYIEHITKDDYTGLLLPFHDMCYSLDGGQSLAYVRSRSPQYFIGGKWVDGSGLADLDRIERQQDFVKRLGRVAVERATDDPRIAPDLADEVIPNLRADTAFDRDAFNALAQALIGLESADGSSIEFATLPTANAFRGGGQSVQLVVQADADPMLARLRGEFTPEAAPEPTTAQSDEPVALRPGDVRVKVLNGSGITGAAGAASNDLGNRGFVRGAVENDPRGAIARTEVRHRSADTAKAALVATYLANGAQLVVDDSLGSDVVVVVGEDFSRVAAPPTSAGGVNTPPTTTLSPEEACR